MKRLSSLVSVMFLLGIAPALLPAFAQEKNPERRRNLRVSEH
jgi:hypothetical protein